MKLKAIKPIYIGGDVVVEGREFETHEQHGRELERKGYAVEVEIMEPAEPAEPAEPLEAVNSDKGKKGKK